ncbi:MAG: hypothetical protein EBW68_08495 [Actinobacteria bacterium]|nr:hypothetical protein [Actinomycetota bacterium]
MSSDVERGFGPGFEKDVAAILATADRGLMYPREVRENLAKAGMIIYEHVDMPVVDPPSLPNDVDDEMQLIRDFDDENNDGEEAGNE